MRGSSSPSHHVPREHSIIKAHLTCGCSQRAMAIQMRPAPRGSNLPNNIEACLQMLCGIIQKYEDNDPNDPAQENDYLQAMDLLKRVNDIKSLQGGAAVPVAQAARIQTVTQVVVQWRERETHHVPRPQLQLGNIGAVSGMRGFITCDICNHMVKDEYALARHKKRITCIRAGIVAGFSAKLLNLVHAVNTRARECNLYTALSCCVGQPFLLELSLILKNAQPIIRRPKPNNSVPLFRKRPFPQRLLPKKLWNSIWDPRGYFHDVAMIYPKDPQRVLLYDPSMFCGKIRITQDMYRHSLCHFGAVMLRLPEPRVWTGYTLANWTEEGPWGDMSLRMCVDVEEEDTRVEDD